ncbi:hydantoinase B/oxoprolinase family protein, partial [Salipiger sp. HF18]|nr:hydantoinase B/oxoprolinase family protein [Salipiger sp. HF18]
AEELSPMIAGLTLGKGENVRLETPGGGGYGAVAERDVAALAGDLRDGRMSRARAEELYGDEKVAAALAGV